MSAFKGEVGKVSEIKEKSKQSGLWQGVKIEVTAIRAVFQGWNFKQDKGVFRCRATDAETHRPATPFGDFQRCYFLKLCYRLYSILPDFAVLMRFSLNTPSVTERKDENGQ